jgi:hypothetical protein
LPLRVLIVGDTTRGEFRDVLPALRASAQVDLQASLTTALAAPDLCVLLQATPGEFSTDELEAQLLRWPLARFVAVAGTLCEGEPRTGRPWPGLVRVYWHEFPAWWALQRARVRQGETPEWGLPRTSREDDVLRQESAVAWPGLVGVVGIVASRSNGTASGLMALVRAAGLNGCLLPEGRGEVADLQVVLWDDDDPSGDWRARILQVRHQWPGVPMVALKNFPRVQDRDWLEAEYGAPCALLAKPYEVDVLLTAMALVVAPRARILP